MRFLLHPAQETFILLLHIYANNNNNTSYNFSQIIESIKYPFN